MASPTLYRCGEWGRHDDANDVDQRLAGKTSRRIQYSSTRGNYWLGSHNHVHQTSHQDGRKFEFHCLNMSHFRTSTVFENCHLALEI